MEVGVGEVDGIGGGDRWRGGVGCGGRNWEAR